MRVVLIAGLLMTQSAHDCVVDRLAEWLDSKTTVSSAPRELAAKLCETTEEAIIRSGISAEEVRQRTTHRD
jgi:hypothetical protein